jgi:WD40 repeat protein
LAVCGNDAKIRLINPADGKVGREMAGHTGATTGIAFLPDGMLATSSRDNTLRVWSTADGKALKTLEGHTGWVQGLVPIPHGSHVASVGADATVRVWDVRK